MHRRVLPSSAIVLSCAAWWMLTSAAAALTIVDNFIPPGAYLPGIGVAGDAPLQSTGGGALQSIMRAAASHWERVIRDDFIVTINYGWITTGDPLSIAFHQGITQSGPYAREVEGSIAFGNDSFALYYLDPTPLDNYEFSPQVFLNADLGGGPVNVMREYAPLAPELLGTNDLLSTAIHEIGHALGLAGWPKFLAEAADGDIDVTLPGYAGTTIPLAGSHMSLVGPAMSGISRPLGFRREISDLDILAVSQLSQFQNYLLPPRADSNGDWKVDALDLLAWTIGFGGPSSADANGDGITDGADFLLWQREYGWTPPPATAVPEPTSTLLVTLGALAALRTSRSRLSASRRPLA